MEFTLYDNVHKFYDDVYSFLAADEAKNMLIFGNLLIGREGKDTSDWRDTSRWVMAAVRNGYGLQTVALMTPPYNITLYGLDLSGISLLATKLAEAGIDIPGVVTESWAAEVFAGAYCKAAGKKQQVAMEQRIYKLDTTPNIPATDARLRNATPRDMCFIPYWYEAFYAEGIGLHNSVSADISQYNHLADGRTFVLEHKGCAVSMAQISRRTLNAACISYVYTPPYFRRKGYAGCAVALLSQTCLDTGCVPVLYTDLANPTSNSIYQKIGYKPIADSLAISFI